MILCLFGTNPYEFTRLAIAIDKVAINFSDDFFVQSGSTTYEFKNCTSVSFLGHDELIEKMKESRLVICQGGYGSIVEALENNKPVISIPRKPQLNESMDEQCETVQYFYNENLIDACFLEGDELEYKIRIILNEGVRFNSYSKFLLKKDNEKVSDIILDYLGVRVVS